MDIPATLDSSLRAGKVIPFVGAGVSMTVLDQDTRERLFPSWPELLNRAADRLEQEQKAADANLVRSLLRLGTPEYLEAARRARQGLGSVWFTFLKEHLDYPRERADDASLRLAQSLWKLGSSLLITTNYDRVLRWACPHQHDLEMWDIEAPAEQVEALRSGVQHPTIWHLHGQINNAAQMILTPDGYQRLYPEDHMVESRYRAALTTLHSLLASRVFLFVGFSLDDDYVTQQLHGIKEIFQGTAGPHYVLLQESARDRVIRLNVPVEVITFPEFGDPLVECLHELGKIATHTHAPIKAPERLPERPINNPLFSIPHSTTPKGLSFEAEMTMPQEGPTRILKKFQEEQLAPAVMQVNPYDFVADIKDRYLFAGRRSEIAKIKDELSRLASAHLASPVVALVGERRVGKTSLLHRISELATELNILPCAVTMTSFLARSAGEFWYEVFQQLLSSATAADAIVGRDIREGIDLSPRQNGREGRAGTQIPPLRLLQWYDSRSQLGDRGVPPLNMVSTDLKSLCNAIKTRYSGTLLMLDEAHFLVDALDITQQLRYALRAASPCGIIFTGEQGLNQMFTDPAAPFYLQANIIPVGNFVAKSDVTECALLPLAENERPLMSPMTMDHLGRLSLGKPNQIRLICHSIYQRYLKKEQPDLNITIEVLDDILEKIQAWYESVYGLKQRVDMIRRLSSVDLEILYLMTRYPEWNAQDVVALDEAFRGEKSSLRALERRYRRLKQKSDAFVKLGLLQDYTDRYMLAGDEFLQVYLRFFYELRKYGNLKKQIQLGKGPPTTFSEKAEKLVRSLAWEVKRLPSVVNLIFFGADAERGDFITDVRDRFTFIESVLQGKLTKAAVRSQVVLESFNLCQLIAQHAQYYLLVIVLRNLENPRESLRLEIYFETGELLVFPLALLTEQAEAAKIQVQEFDSWFVEIPTLDEFVRRLSGGHTLDEFIAETDTIVQWMVRSVQRLVEKGTSTAQVTQEEPDEDEESDWVDLYHQRQHTAAVNAITTQLDAHPRRAIEARLYNDRGYIRYDLPNESENAKRDLERALNLHHRALPLTLLNLSIIAIDSQDYTQAIELIEDILLITHGRESMRASFLRLRLLAGHLLFTKREKWEQHPANVLEAAYVNLAYASAHQNGYDAAREILEESLELLPSSIHLRHALARLHLWKRRADLANPLYQELSSEMLLINDIGIVNEVKNYLKLYSRKRKRR